MSKVIPTSGLRAAILDSIKMQLEFGVGRRSVVLANLDNIVLAFEIVILLDYEQSYYYFRFAGGHLGFHQDAGGVRCRSSFSCVAEPAYIVLAFGIAFLSSIRPKLLLLPVYRPPCWTQGVVNKASRVALHFLALVVPDSIIITFKIFFRPKYGPRYGNFSFTAAILNFRLNGMSNNVGDGTIEKFDPENMG
jgi:hypothetical protein